MLNVYFTRGESAVTVHIDGAEQRELTLNPGEAELLTVAPGTYTVAVRPQNANEDGQAEGAITVDGAPVEVTDCVPAIEVDYSFSCPGKGLVSGIDYRIHNPSRERVVLTRDAVGHPYTDTDTYVLESGETVESMHYDLGLIDFDVYFSAVTDSTGETVLVNGEEEYEASNPC